MRLQAHQAVGEGVVALVDQQLHAQKFAARLRHLARAFDEEIIVHPQSRAARVAATMRLVLRDLVRMVDFAVVDAAGVDIERKAEQRSEEHTSELQSLMRNSYAVFCLKKKILNQTKEAICLIA